MRDLNDLLINGSGWELSSGQDINNSGQIVGIGTINGQTHGFLLNPSGAPDCIPTLSELGMIAMAGLMLLAGGVVIARRRAAVAVA
jgi:probable HAF family extracellular repeat protein